MAQNQNNKNSEGVCEKIYNAVSGGRKLHLISHHAHAQGSAPRDNPRKPSHRMIPIEFEPSIRPSPMSQKENIQTTTKNDGKDDGTKRVSEISVQETAINEECHHLKGKMEGKTQGQVEKVPSTRDKLPSRASMEGKTKLKARMASMAKTKFSDEYKKIEPKKTNDKFSDYIDSVKNKMRTVSTVVGGGSGSGSGGAGVGVGRTATRRDSFNNKVSSYIKKTKMKIRTTANFDGKSSTFK
ncbi:unnamed protein product [Fraxinus pennsylvanica]|uniref:Uncharacterized protein n=1 Tax=Fraxinus pennsylvanica TaxID=56036 RepID=A0AAD2ACH4_9LAMI|nr:unnamed protein product [Fraxinus pennsylvanica]